MTVAELIDLLKTLPTDARVFVRGYDDGDDINQAVPIKVTLNANSEWFYGAHDVVRGGSSKVGDCNGYELTP